MCVPKNFVYQWYTSGLVVDGWGVGGVKGGAHGTVTCPKFDFARRGNYRRLDPTLDRPRVGKLNFYRIIHTYAHTVPYPDSNSTQDVELP